MNTEYDIIVVGAGHAGCEAAGAAANMGSKVLLITMDMFKFAHMSCNPAMGGIAKGQIVREIDALGGYSGIVTDKSMIQFRMLNRSKGPAMWSPRAQCDRVAFSIEWRNHLELIPNLFFWQDEVVELLISQSMVLGVKTRMGVTFKAKSVILSNGTFLNGLIHIGKAQINGGRAGESSSKGITEQLVAHGLESGRMKTGTPARIDARSIDFSKLLEQQGDLVPGRFSYLEDGFVLEKQKSCFIAYTNPSVHDFIEGNIHESPMYDGTIVGIGPRYCPSIETKIMTFRDKDRHQLFLEPEGWNTVEYYINGFSSSLPLDVQYNALQKVEGLENVRIFRPGYAIEYDFFPPIQLHNTLETKAIKNLYFTGQINGTTGYEEAAAQGIMAGINAHLRNNGKDPFILQRDEAYIGVLIDDLITKGVDEPYRMFTSRAEYRILLRQDNADHRLTERSFQIGLANHDRYDRFRVRNSQVDHYMKFLKNKSVKPNEVNEILKSKDSAEINQGVKLATLLLRPEMSIFDLDKFIDTSSDSTLSVKHIFEQVEILIKYEGYIEKEKEFASKVKALENIFLPESLPYSTMLSISTEGRQKLEKIKPKTLGQASRIPGVSPADISVLMVFIGR